MNIAEVRGKCKSALARIPRDMLVIAILVVSSSLSFGLGYLAGQDTAGTSGTRLETAPQQVSTSEVGASTSDVGVVSKNGTKYYLPGCAGVDRISDTNKVSFPSAAAALAAGYTPAANCKGL